MKKSVSFSLLSLLLACMMLLCSCGSANQPVAEAAQPEPADWMALDMSWVTGQNFDGIQIMEIRRQSDTHLEIAHVPVTGVQALDDLLAADARARMDEFEAAFSAAQASVSEVEAADTPQENSDAHFMLECAVTQNENGMISIILAQQDSLRHSQGQAPLISIESYDKATGAKANPLSVFELSGEIQAALSPALRTIIAQSGVYTAEDEWLVTALQDEGSGWNTAIAQNGGAALVLTQPSGDMMTVSVSHDQVAAAKKSLEKPAQPDPVKVQGKKLVALTFDDGPTKTHTPRLLDILKEYGVKCTFFMQGVNVKARPETVKRVYEEGHEIGNHTYDHPNLTKISFDEVDEQLNKTADLVEDACGFRPRLVRPPYGSTTYSLRDHMRDELDMPCIKWSVDARDSFTDSADELVQTCLNETKDGDIILLHDTHDYSVDAVPRIIKGLQEKGFTFVTVSELLTRNGDKILGGESYQYCRPASE